MSKMEKETRLILAIILSLLFMLIEIVGGYLANSIAIFSDAAHLLTDIAGFIIALIATIAAKSPGTKTLTFGMARAEVFGALGSILSLWVITAFLLYAAFFRAVAWFEGRPEPVDGFLMFVVACFGVVVNLCLGYVFHEDHGGAFHPGHSHDHGHASHGSDNHDHHEEPASNKGSNESSSKKSGGTHDHSHEHKGDSSHGHSHDHVAETTPLLPNVSFKSNTNNSASVKAEPFAFTKASKCSGHSHDSGSAGHRVMEETPEKAAPKPFVVKAVSTQLHDHDHDHDHGHSHDHDHGAHSHAGHDHSDRDLEAGRGKKEGGYGSVGHADSHDDHSAHGGHDHHNHGHNHGSDVNLEAAYLHVLTDLIQSIGVAIAGAVLWWQPHWQIIDPICTVLFSIVALNSTIPLINRVGMILFEGTPSHVDWEIVMARFQALPGVEDVHDLHIWSISSNSISLTCHIRAVKPQETLLAAHGVCRKLGIDHATIQVHDANDARFCYSETCDVMEEGAAGANGNGTGKRKACV